MATTKVMLCQEECEKLIQDLIQLKDKAVKEGLQHRQEVYNDYQGEPHRLVIGIGEN